MLGLIIDFVRTGAPETGETFISLNATQLPESGRRRIDLSCCRGFDELALRDAKAGGTRRPAVFSRLTRSRRSRAARHVVRTVKRDWEKLAHIFSMS